jgi:hypothetical protein
MKLMRNAEASSSAERNVTSNWLRMDGWDGYESFHLPAVCARVKTLPRHRRCCCCISDQKVSTRISLFIRRRRRTPHRVSVKFYKPRRVMERKFGHPGNEMKFKPCCGKSINRGLSSKVSRATNLNLSENVFIDTRICACGERTHEGVK